MGGGGAGGRGGASGAAGSGVGGAGQVILSVDFIGGNIPSGTTVVPAPAMAATEVAGVKPAANWNGAATNMGTLANLVLASGAATAAIVTWNSPVMGTNPGEWKNPYADTPGNARMMNGYLDPPASSTPATITVSGLPAAITGGGYDVYVYVAGNIANATTRTYGYAIGATSVTVTDTGPTPTTFPGFTLAPAGGAGNYIVFRSLTAASFTLTATPGTGNPMRAPVNGLQIVSPSGS
jgi:hypothetical protein